MQIKSVAIPLLGHTSLDEEGVPIFSGVEVGLGFQALQISLLHLKPGICSQEPQKSDKIEAARRHLLRGFPWNIGVQGAA